MFSTHNPYYGSKQLNKHNCAEKLEGIKYSKRGRQVTLFRGW